MTIVGRVDSLWRYPVKSMRGEELREVFLGFPGVYGDRAYAFRNARGRKAFPFFTAREQARMLRFSAAYRHPERMTAPPNLAEAEALGPGVTPLYAGAADWMVDVATPTGEVLAVDDARLVDLLRPGAGEGTSLSLLRSERALTDCRPLSLISMQTVAQLGREAGVDDFDKRRFRANLFVDLAQAAGFGEDAWVGQRLRIGSKAVVAVTDRDPRCMMITLDPETTQPNPEVMRRVAGDHGGAAGVYAAVLVEGMIRSGDPIARLD